MTGERRHRADWLISAVVVLGLLVLGHPLLVPFAFALLLWAILNALADVLMRAKFPAWLAWLSSVVLIAASIYVIARIFVGETSAMATQAPVYWDKLQHLANEWWRFLRLGPMPALSDLFSASGVANVVGQAAASAGNLLFQFALVAIYVGFLLAEQRYLPGKLARLATTSERRDETGKVLNAIARQLQKYLGVCTLLSVTMALVTYALLTLLGVDFAGFWALIMFFANYIPTVGGAAVVFPALSALLQSGSLGQFLLVALVLFGVHFVLANIVSTVMLGRTLNMSPLAIILALSFWGLVWGVAGLFLAVPMTGALLIVCQHIESLRWVAIALAGPEAAHAKKIIRA